MPIDGSRARERLERQKARLTRFEDVPVVGLGVSLYHRDRESQGSVVGSAIAFRLFLFFVPLLLFAVGILGFVSGFVSSNDLDHAAGVSGGLAAQINSAFEQPGATRWIAVLLGLFGMVTAGRALGKVLWSASAAAWRRPQDQRAPIRVLGSLVGLVIGMGLLSVVENRIRAELGLGVATVSLVAVFLFYAVAWLWVSTMLPRGTTDPGASLPGALLVAVSVTALQAVSQFYLPGRLSRARQLYGAIGTTIVTLSWFFILGRAIVISLELDAVLHERFGSISGFVFSLPVIRPLAHRSRHVRKFFDLDDAAGTGPGDSPDT